ncbi:MAG: hypothetical protein ACTHNS_16200 [Marmoricola sp.]
MTKTYMKAGALVGVASIAVLAAGPAMGATHISQATAQSLQLSIAGNSAISQQVSATNDGNGAKTVDNSTVPTIASVIPGNTLLGVGVAPQLAGANIADNGDGNSFACAGIAGTGGGVVKVGDSSCKINGTPLTLDLANLSLGNVILGNDSALGSALNSIPGLGALLTTLGTNLNGLVTQIDDGIKGTPLGEVKLGGSLSAIEGICTANPSGAQGTANIVDSSGGAANTPITVTLPGAGPIDLVDLPANPAPNTHVVVDLNKVTQTLIDGIKQELNNAVNGQLKAIGVPAGTLLQTIQDQVVTTLVDNLRDPLLTPLQQNLLDITLNKQSTGDAGKSIDLTALDLQVLPAAKQIAGSSFISGAIGHVTCGPNGRLTASTPTPAPPSEPPVPPQTPSIPRHVDSGLASYDGGSDANVWIAAVAALLALGGGAGTLAYRRYGMPRG